MGALSRRYRHRAEAVVTVLHVIVAELAIYLGTIGSPPAWFESELAKALVFVACVAAGYVAARLLVALAFMGLPTHE